MQKGDRDSIRDLITFLEVDPIFHRSGYLKEHLLRLIKNAPRTPHDDQRLRAVIWNRAGGPNRREFKLYCQLASRINTPDFTEQVRQAAKIAPGPWSKFSFILQYPDI